MSRLVTKSSKMRRATIVVSMTLSAAFCITGAGIEPSASAQQASYVDRVSHLAGLSHERLCDPTHAHSCKAHRLINEDGTHAIAPRASLPSGFGPSDLQAAYGVDPKLGAGMTVAIVDAFGYSKAEADLATYRSTYGLPACTSASGCFKVLGQTGGAPPADPTNSTDAQWNGEAALDVDMVSAACPSCKIILILTNSDQDDGLFLGQQVAATAGADVVSNSWGGPDTNPASEEHYLQTTPQIGIFVASGDAGYNNGGSGPDYPSTSLLAIGVGGTNLVKSSSARGWSETPWGASSKQAANGSAGSSCSTAIAKPSYQAAFVTDTVCKFRAASDVASVADPNTGVAVYQGGWGVYGGTSAASPFAAAVFAMTGHATVGPEFPYANVSAFYDVAGGTTSNVNGSCGAPLCMAGVGWDGQTGLGSLNAAALGKIPGTGTSAPDMAVIPDMARPEDMARPADDLSTPVGTGGNGGGSGSGGGTGQAGGGGKSGGSGNDGGCGCSLGGADSGNGLLALPLALALLGLAIYRRRRA
jgi:MYXO-CTERM domain-containing protein